MITIEGKVYLADVGAHERIYEGVAADVEVTFDKDGASLGDIRFDEDTIKYITDAGSTLEYWSKAIRVEFDDEGDYLLDHIIEDLEIAEYGRAEAFISAYYQDRPMPDAEAYEIPLQQIEKEWLEHIVEDDND